MGNYITAGFRSWWNLEKFVVYFFSLPMLAKTLFSGWQRDTADEREWWERLILKGIFIVFGFIFRILVLVVGVVVLLAAVVFLPLFILFPIRLSYEQLVKIGSIGKSWAYGTAPTLHRFGVALYKGRDKKLYGREETLEQMIRILSRDGKDNVLLVGGPGMGKHTLVAQLAKSVYRGLVPTKLKNREVIEIPLGATSVETLRQMFVEAEHAGNLIVVLYEPEKYQGVLDELLPLVQATELQVIVETTVDGYLGFWKDRLDVLRFFEKVEIPSLSDAATLEFLSDTARERYPRIHFESGVFEEVVRRTNELIQTKPQPEKSLDLLEEAVVGATVVTIADIDRLLSQKTGVPLGTLERDEKEVLLTLEETLRREIIGQEEAVADIASALRRARTGVASKGKPIGSFLFLGPTGNGKTHTAKMLARHYFGGDGSMVRFDMSEFALAETERLFVKRLTTTIEEYPYGLLFFDELEKADRKVTNVLLQVLDEGRLTSERGRTVSFINTIIIATSNAGTAHIETEPDMTKDALRSYLVGEQVFSPEFLNRFDDLVVFRPLSLEDALAITRLLLTELNARLQQERGVRVDVTDTLVARLAEQGFDQRNGARALRRTVQNVVENAVADALLRDQVTPGTELAIG